jgi:hypothetical protein
VDVFADSLIKTSKRPGYCRVAHRELFCAQQRVSSGGHGACSAAELESFYERSLEKLWSLFETRRDAHGDSGADAQHDRLGVRPIMKIGLRLFFTTRNGSDD